MQSTTPSFLPGINTRFARVGDQYAVGPLGRTVDGTLVKIGDAHYYRNGRNWTVPPLDEGLSLLYADDTGESVLVTRGDRLNDLIDRFTAFLVEFGHVEIVDTAA